jgi:hypothetical protein
MPAAGRKLKKMDDPWAGVIKDHLNKPPRPEKGSAVMSVKTDGSDMNNDITGKRDRTQPDSLIKQRYFNYDLFCTEFTIYTALNHFSQSDPFLFAQAFSDRIKVWWPTDRDLDGFVAAVIAAAPRIENTASPGRGKDKSGRSDGCPWEIYLYLDNYDVQHLKIENLTSLGGDGLRRHEISGGGVQLYRIAVKGCDFYFDCTRRESSRHRAGITTILDHNDLIYGFLASTHAQGFQENYVRAVIEELVASSSSS